MASSAGPATCPARPARPGNPRTTRATTSVWPGARRMPARRSDVASLLAASTMRDDLVEIVDLVEVRRDGVQVMLGFEAAPQRLPRSGPRCRRETWKAQPFGCARSFVVSHPVASSSTSWKCTGRSGRLTPIQERNAIQRSRSLVSIAWSASSSTSTSSSMSSVELRGRPAARSHQGVRGTPRAAPGRRTSRSCPLGQCLVRGARRSRRGSSPRRSRRGRRAATAARRRAIGRGPAAG